VKRRLYTGDNDSSQDVGAMYVVDDARRQLP